MNNVYRFTHHALNRMESRKVSEAKVARIMSCGQIFGSKHGVHKARIWENTGSIVNKYTVVFSKQDNCIITVEHNVFPAKNTKHGDNSFRKERKLYKRRKQNMIDREFDSWCREEYENHDLRFSA